MKRKDNGASEPAKAKRARSTVSADEYRPVTTLEAYRVPLYRADCFYVDHFIDTETANRWHDALDRLSTWYQPTLKVYGKPVVQSRHIAAYATDPELKVKYSGTDVIMHHSYPPVLEEIQTLVEERCGVTFNHVMLNRYENGQIYIGKHRDNLENRVIASVSVGAPRTFVLEYAPGKKAPPDDPEDARDKLRATKFVLANGSLVAMQGDMQVVGRCLGREAWVRLRDVRQYWKHSIPKEPKVKQSRISLTFRQLCF